MFSFLFFDPRRLHPQSKVDSDILSLRCLHCLYDCVSYDNHFRQIACICCPNATPVIDEVRRRQPDILIYLCKDHSGDRIDPSDGPNVRDDIVFKPDNQWEARCREALVENLDINHHQAQIFDEVERIEMIKQRYIHATGTPTNVVDQQGNIPSNIANG